MMQDQYKDKKEWLEAAQEAMSYTDVAEAYKMTKLWTEFIGQPIVSPQSEQSLEWLRQGLLLTAFPALPAEQAVYVLRVLTRQFFELSEDQLSAAQKIENRFAFVGYGFYEEERARLLEALKASEATIGGKTMSEWLSHFDGFRPTNEERKAEEFLLQAIDGNSQKADKFFLEEVLHTYEAYLQYPVFNIYDYAVVTQSMTQGQNLASQSGGSQSQERLALLQALAKYPNLGNQNISQERIKIKSQPDPVRASLYNWIKYYRDELGIGQHSTVERGQFLFRSENGKALSPLERERVNLILKSLEENLPLEIDTERQEIVFPVIDMVASVPSQPLAPIPAAVPQAGILEAPQAERLARPAPKPFVPQPIPPRPADPVSMAQKFQPSTSPYQKVSIPPRSLSLEPLAALKAGIDVSQMAEKLKREPKPEWIKGTFTKENIPDSAPIAPAVGSMSFSFNHALPAEQEAGAQKETSVAEPQEARIPAAPTGSSQFHIRPVSRRDDAS